MTRWLLGGLRVGARIEYFATATPEERLQALATQAVANRAAPSGPGPGPGELTWRPANSVYTPTGRFDPDDMLETLRGGYDRLLTAAADEPAPVMFSGEMDWALQPGCCDLNDLVRYEVEVSAIATERPFCAICQYDAGRFEPEFLYEILKAHPYMVMNGQIIPSPYYAPPGRGRGTAPPAPAV